MNRSVHWQQMTWTEIEAAAARRAVVVIPTGSIEQHGLHLPTGTDVLISQGLADRLVAAMPGRGFIIAPPFTYTIARLNTPFPGTVNLCGPTLVAMAREVVSELLRQGFDRILFLNGHMESVAFLMEGAELALHGHGAGEDGPVVIWSNWWDFVGDDLIDDIFGDRWPGWEAEHAALTETSLMQCLWPDLVRPLQSGGQDYEELPYKNLSWPARTRPRSGSYADPRGADATIGERLAAAIVAGYRRLVETEFPAASPPGCGRGE